MSDLLIVGLLIGSVWGASILLWRQRERHHDEIKTLLNILATFIGEKLP